MLKLLVCAALLCQLCLNGISALAASESPELSSEEMLGSMLMFGFRGYNLAQDDPVRGMLQAGNAGAVLLFDKDVKTGGERNIQDAAQLKALTAEIRECSRLPVWIGIDQEGGQVRRLKPQKGFMDLPSAQVMGQGSVAATLQQAGNLGQELASLGINLDLAPVADVDSNPFNPVIGKLGRAFNSDPALVAAHALAFGRGLARHGVVPVLKHFPGQGCAGHDSHLEPADISQCWDADTDLRPYAEIFRAGWPGMVMIGHLTHKRLDPELPASLSKTIVTGLLRDGLGWQGVVLTDDLQMKAISGRYGLKESIALAVEAGVDILVYGNNLDWDAELPSKVWQAALELVQEGRISRERLHESWQRIHALHDAYAQAATQTQ